MLTACSWKRWALSSFGRPPRGQVFTAFRARIRCRPLCTTVKWSTIGVKKLHRHGHQNEHHSREKQKPATTTAAFQHTQGHSTPAQNRRHTTKGVPQEYSGRAASHWQPSDQGENHHIKEGTTTTTTCTHTNTHGAESPHTLALSLIHI